MIPHGESYVEQAAICAASKSIITLFCLTMTGVPVKQEVFVSKDLFGLGLTNAMPLIALSGVALIPLKAGNQAEIYYRLHIAG